MGSPRLCGVCASMLAVPGADLGANKMARWSARSCVQQDEEVDQILELAVDYAVRRSYPPGLTKEKKRAVRKRASTSTSNNIPI